MSSLTLKWSEKGQICIRTLNSQQASHARGVIRIGRNPAICDLVLSDRSVSGVHVEIFWYKTQCYIRNLRASNPPMVDGVSLAQDIRQLYLHSRVRLGHVELDIIELAAPLENLNIQFKKYWAYSPEEWSLENTRLVRRHGPQIDLSTLTQARFKDYRGTKYQGYRRVVELQLENNVSALQLICIDELKGSERQKCFYLISRVLDVLAQCHPNLKIYIGADHVSRTLSAVFGGILALIGVGWTIASFFFHAALSSLYLALSIGVGITYFLCGVIMVQIAAPWANTPMVVPNVLQKQIDKQMQTEYLNSRQ